MSVPDAALRFGLTLPAIDRAFALTMLLAAFSGGSLSMSTREDRQAFDRDRDLPRWV